MSGECCNEDDHDLSANSEVSLILTGRRIYLGLIIDYEPALGVAHIRRKPWKKGCIARRGQSDALNMAATYIIVSEIEDISHRLRDIRIGDTFARAREVTTIGERVDCWAR